MTDTHTETMKPGDGLHMLDLDPAIAAALVDAQALIQPVGKTATNKHLDYKYASGDDIVAEGRGALNSAGLALIALRSWITETPFQWADEKGVIHDDVNLRLNVVYQLLHRSGVAYTFSAFSVPVIPERGRPIDKAEAGARTYALSYFIRELLLIPRVSAETKGEETDPDQRDDRNWKPKQQVRRQAAPTTPPQSPPATKRRGPRALERLREDCLRHGLEEELVAVVEAAGGNWTSLPEDCTRLFDEAWSVVGERLKAAKAAALDGAQTNNTPDEVAARVAQVTSSMSMS